MVFAASAFAILLYLLPIVWGLGIVTAGRLSSGRAAVTVPALVAGDLAILLVIARLMPLANATFVSRFLWVVAESLWMRRNGVRAADLFRGLPTHVWRGALLAAAATAAVSLTMSVPYWIWDREWHVPFTSVLRAERLPFGNIYEPGWQVRYHHAGDVLAAELQVLSLGVIHSSRAISLAHDTLFALLGCTVGLLVQSFGFNRPIATAMAPLGVVLAGPVWFRDGPRGLFEGYSDFNNLTLSFRPHVALASLLVVGVAGAALVRTFDPHWSPRAFLTVVFACILILAVSDEASALLLIGALGVGYCAEKQPLRQRWRGFVALGGLAATFLGANVAFAGSLSPGGPVSSTVWGPPRLPGFGVAPPMPLSAPAAWSWLGVDVGFEAAIVLALGVFAASRPQRGRWVVFLSAAALGVGSLLPFLGSEVNGLAFENHRFLTAWRLVAPLCALLIIGIAPRGSLATWICYLALAGAAASTAGFVFIRMEQLQPYKEPGQYAVNCWEQAGARPLERPVPTYMSEEIWFLYAGCHPVYAPAAQRRKDMKPNYMKAGVPLYGQPALDALEEEMLPAGDPLLAICPATDSADTLCRRFKSAGLCKPLARDVSKCIVPPADRPGFAESPRRRN